jgi:hypothetical protein
MILVLILSIILALQHTFGEEVLGYGVYIWLYPLDKALGDVTARPM